jgi:hypothetical protein
MEPLPLDFAAVLQLIVSAALWSGALLETGWNWVDSQTI